jgi:hypothetical protein
MGEFNLNLINHHCQQLTGEFLDAMYSRMFYPLITNPTRITEHTATPIDNIFTNRIENHLKSGILFTDISDHFMARNLRQHGRRARASYQIRVIENLADIKYY